MHVHAVSTRLVLVINISVLNFILFVGLSIKEGDRFLCDAILALEDELGTEWFKLGLCLDVDIGVLYRSKHSTSTLNDCRNGTRDMLIAWKQQFDKEATWDKIVAALREIKFNELAQKVEEQFIHSTIIVPSRCVEC